MIAAISSELRKFFTTRLWWGMAIAVFVSARPVRRCSSRSSTRRARCSQAGRRRQAPRAQVANSVYTAGLGVGYLLLLTIGVMQIGSEYRHKTITATFLATPEADPRRWAPRSSRSLVIGAFYGLLSLVGVVAVGALVLRPARLRRRSPPSEVWRTAALSLLVLGLWALIGLGAGILIPNQVAALLISVGVAWIVEPLARSGWASGPGGATTSSRTCRPSATSAIIERGPALEHRGPPRLVGRRSRPRRRMPPCSPALGIWRTVAQDIS